jgi:hypothetical protein
MLPIIQYIVAFSFLEAWPFDMHATQKAIVSLLARPWFRRVWVIQEFVVSPDISIMCGRETCEYSSFSIAFHYAFEGSNLIWSSSMAAQSQRTDFYQGLSQMLKLHDRKLAFNDETEGPPSLLGLLTEHRTALATRADDKIYALIGLSGDYANFKPDYETPTSELYLRIGKDLVNQGHGELVLRQAAMSDRTTHTAGLTSWPSWIPDWSESPQRADFSDIISASGWFFKAGGAKTTTGPKALFSHEGRVLTAKGAVIQTVEVLGKVETERVPGCSNLSNLMTLMNDIQMWQAQFPKLYPKPAQRYPTDEQPNTVAAAILVAGQSSAPTAFAKVHKDLSYDMMVEFELDNPTDDAKDVEAIHLVRDFHKDNPDAVRNMTRAVSGRLFCVSCTATEELYAGLVPASARSGDKIVVLQGCAVPYVLRPLKMDGNVDADGHEQYALVGDCYIHGIMDGEALVDGLEMEDIQIR